jgi:hypothetical protein
VLRQPAAGKAGSAVVTSSFVPTVRPHSVRFGS